MVNETRYTRVIPRDLFNESKLLKCLGQLTLKIHDGKAPGLTVEDEGDEFDVRQEPSDGTLYVANLKFQLHGEEVDFRSRYNSKAAYPLDYHGPGSSDDPTQVFGDEGEFTPEFAAILQHKPY